MSENKVIFSQVKKSLKECCKLYVMIQDHPYLFQDDLFESLNSSIFSFYVSLYPNGSSESIVDMVNEILG